MARKPQDNPQLDMTPMIDVVFELIIFFVVTIKQEDLFTQLNANRPAPSTSQSESNDNQIKIQVGRGRTRDGLILYNGAEVKRDQLFANLRLVAATSTKQPIIVTCSLDSPHKALVDVLDCCYENKLYSVSIFSE